MTPVLQTAVGLAIPFVGTALGAAAVFLFKSNIPPRVQKILFKTTWLVSILPGVKIHRAIFIIVLDGVA